MTMHANEHDVAAWAARIRPHFDAPLQDVAEVVALAFAPSVGPRITRLRPETTMSEFLRWVQEATPGSFKGTDWVETLMGIEKRLGGSIGDAFAESLDSHTFGELVAHLQTSRRD